MDQGPGSGTVWVCNDCGIHENVAGAFMSIGPKHTCQADLDDTTDYCPQPCEHLSAEDARDGKDCLIHPCTCTKEA